MRILVTRPKADAERTAKRLAESGHHAVLSPLTRLEILAPLLPLSPTVDALLITSRNAVRALVSHPQIADIRMLPVLAVGESTADLARQNGFAEVVAAEGTATSLVELAAKRLSPGQKTLYLAGRDRAADIAGALKPHAIDTQVVVVYAAEAEAGLSDAASAMLSRNECDAVLHYSARSARLFLLHVSKSDALERSARRCAHLCLSSQVATTLKPLSAETVLMAQNPDEDSLMDLLPSLARLNRTE